MDNYELIEMLYKLFVGRRDVIAQKHPYGYAPICKNAHTELCPKMRNLRAKCKGCKSKKYSPVTDQLLNDHINGRITLGTYPLFKNNTCKFVVADFDKHDKDLDNMNIDPYHDAYAYLKECIDNGFPAYALKSQSGNGYHIYIFFETRIPAWKAIKIAEHLLEEAGVDRKTSSFDKFIPTKGELKSDDALGSLIALPFQGGKMENGNTILC